MLKISITKILTIIVAAVVLGACATQSPRSSDRLPPLVATEAVQQSGATSGAADAPELNAADDPEEDLSWLEEDEADIETIADPLEGFNRAMFTFNDRLYYWALKPVAIGYRAVVPQPARIGVKNFLHHLGFPVRFVNAILQAKPPVAAAELTRFLYNSTFGVLGFGNPAKKHPALNCDEEDLGQTFGRYGVGDGFYLVLPFFGPSSLRDSLGLVGDYFLDPFVYVDPSAVAWAVKGLDAVNSTSLRIGDYESFKSAAFDPYLSLRDGYLQQRQAKIRK